MYLHYSSSDPISEGIIIKEKGTEKQKIDKAGLILLKLITNNGHLEANY